VKSFVRVLAFTLSVIGAAFVSCESTYAQCSRPELVKGADKYNELVCQAFRASRRGNKQKTLELLLRASEQPVLESPNIRLFGPIARTHAELGHFEEASRYLKYDDLSTLWMIGIIRCQTVSESTNESLFQDGEILTTNEASHMAGVLCGPIFDEYSYFRDRSTDSFVPAAKAILHHAILSKEIDHMRDPHRRGRP